MESSNNTSKENKKENENDKQNPNIENIKSNFFLEKLYDNIQKKKKFEIVKYNKKIQNRLNLSIKDYKEFSNIEIEIIPTKDKYGKFINVNKKDKSYYHIYFSDNKEEIKNKYKIKKGHSVINHQYFIREEDKVIKIKIIIDYQVKSFKKLFYLCKCIESINVKNL